MRGMGFFTIFGQEKEATIAMGLFFLGSIVSRLVLAGLYQGLIRGTDNLAITENRQLKQCKLKFAHCYQLNRGVANIPVFVDKFISRLSVGPFSYDFFYHLSGQLMLLSIVALSVGVCRSLIRGRSLLDILPFYIAALVALYVYLSISALTDIRGKRRKLKINLVDYLENHLMSRYPVTAQDMELLYGRKGHLLPMDSAKARRNKNGKKESRQAHQGMGKSSAEQEILAIEPEKGNIEAHTFAEKDDENAGSVRDKVQRDRREEANGREEAVGAVRKARGKRKEETEIEEAEYQETPDDKELEELLTDFLYFP